MKVAFAFWGLPRSLKFTIKSLHKYVFDIFKKENIDYDIYMHAYILNGTYTNKRTKEFSNNIDNEQYKLLNCFQLKLDIQNDIIQKLNLKQYHTHKDPWNTNYNSVNNFILSMYSKYIVTNMIKKNINQYDYIIYLRPDVLYLNNFPINSLQLCKNNQICIPNFHLFGFFRNLKFNDRFAICNKNNFQYYGEIFKHLLDISKKMPLHSETIISKFLFENKINFIPIPFFFNRVRVNGKIENDNNI